MKGRGRERERGTLKIARDTTLSLTRHKRETHTQNMSDHDPNPHNTIKQNTNHPLGNWGRQKNSTTNALNAQIYNNI